MSVYTLLNQNQLEGLLAQYDIGGLESYVEIADGIENSNYLIKSLNKDFVLTIFERAASTDLLPYLNFMAIAQAEGKAVPCPLLNKQGERLSFFEYQQQGEEQREESSQKRFILCEKLLGAHPQIISTELCEHLGEQVAGLHKLTIPEKVKAQFPLQTLPSFILDIDFKNILSKEKLSLFKEELAHIKRLEDKSSALPKGIVHCDFFPDNALTLVNNNRETISAFLDWYDARQTFLLIDLAIIAVSWCTNDKHQIVTEKEQALLKGYQKELPFNTDELALWNDFLRAAALFFWISREDYHAQMHLQGKASSINPQKSTEEFWEILQTLKAR